MLWSVWQRSASGPDSAVVASGSPGPVAAERPASPGGRRSWVGRGDAPERRRDVAEKTGISWTDHTFNIAWGCQKVSPGCKNCYAEGLSTRYGHGVWGPNKPRRTFGEKHWAAPIAWNRASEKAHRRGRVFCSSMCDNFEDHPMIAAELARLWPLIRATPELDWQLLTKRADRIRERLPADWGDGYANVWLGVSVENRDYEWRIDLLRMIAARVRFVSYEPALGSIAGVDLCGIHWLIYGGESGPSRRDDHVQWAPEALAFCRAAVTKFFFKQRPGPRPGTGTMGDGTKPREFPLRVLGETSISR